MPEMTIRRWMGVALLGCLVAALVLWLRGGDETIEASGVEVLADDPYRFDPGQVDELTRAAARGLAHPLYELSPGGIEATAERTARLEDRVRAAAAREADVDPATLEALVFLESAGRPDAIAGPTPESAAGLGQILPGTATDLLDMSVDLGRSKELTERIAEQEERLAKEAGARAEQRDRRTLERLVDERRKVDKRFDPDAALRGAARYLAIAQKHFGTEDMAVASYHMGIGNLENLIETYVPAGDRGDTARETVERNGLSFARLYFDSSPARNPETDAALRELDDDSRHYLFKVEAARDILGLWREDRAELGRLATLHAEKASAEEVLRPPEETQLFATSESIEQAYEDGELVVLEDDPARLGYRVAAEMGELAARVDQPPELYRGLRPEALATVVYVARELRAAQGDRATLTLTSSVRDEGYQELLRGTSDQATDGYSLHTSGFAFDVARDLSDRQEAALVASLERLRALNVADWVYEPDAIHVTVGPEAERLLAESGPF